MIFGTLRAKRKFEYGRVRRFNAARCVEHTSFPRRRKLVW